MLLAETLREELLTKPASNLADADRRVDEKVTKSAYESSVGEKEFLDGREKTDK